MTGTKHICPQCGKDLTEAVKIHGQEGMRYHLKLHAEQARQDEIDRLRAGLEELRDGGYGCQVRAQEILDATKDAR